MTASPGQGSLGSATRALRPAPRGMSTAGPYSADARLFRNFRRPDILNSNGYLTTNLVRGSEDEILWGDVSQGAGAPVEWSITGGTAPMSWTSLNPTVTASCAALCYDVTQMLTAPLTTTPNAYTSCIQEVPSDGPHIGQALANCLNWNVLQIDVTAVSTTKQTVSTTLGGYSKAMGLYDTLFSGTNLQGYAATFYLLPRLQQLGVGSFSNKLLCLQYPPGTYTSAFGIWAAPDDFDPPPYSVPGYIGKILTLNPPLKIPSAALLKKLIALEPDAKGQAAAMAAIPALLSAFVTDGFTIDQMAALFGQIELESDFVNTVEGEIQGVDPNSVAEQMKSFEDEYGIANNPINCKGCQTGYNAAGNSMAGDGYTFRGRGYIQITGRYNYINVGNALGIDLVDDPDMAATPTVAAEIAAYFVTHPSANPADETISYYVNGNGPPDFYDVRKMINPGAPSAEFSTAAGYAKAFDALMGGC